MKNAPNVKAAADDMLALLRQVVANHTLNNSGVQADEQLIEQARVIIRKAEGFRT